MKFNKNSKVLTEVLDVTKNYIEFKSSSDSLKDKQSLSLAQYIHKCDNIHSYEWSNFQNIEQFGSFFISSNQFPLLEFIYRWGDDLQSIPKIQSFMSFHKNESKECYRSKFQLISVIARPLLLILQETFWTGLMWSYLKYVHPFRPLFNLVNFDPKSASKSLLSAIYFAGFITQTNHSIEIYSYMQGYAMCNIKKMLFKINLSNAQALGIYAHAFYLNGNYSLSRVCLSHFGRMCNALGTGINRKKLHILDQHNRKLVHNIVKLYYNWEKLGRPPYGLASQEDEFDLDIYEPKYQLPNSNLNLCNNDYEGAAYSVFCCQFTKISNFTVVVNSKFCQHDSNIIKMEIESLSSKANEIYNNTILTLEPMINLIPEYKNRITEYLNLVKCSFIVCMLCIHSKMLESSENSNLGIIQNILDKGIELWELMSSNKYLIDIWSFGPFIAGFHLIQIYPLCANNQKEKVLYILKSIIQLYYREGYNINSMNFLLLQTQLKLINDKNLL
ncbi:hypothetical protein CONCODRAFT_9495 [Conidiobolus coronatus NRRL 28638]|uniref:Transcription factor domain-containing protein n=1 Tax=Conidiobolus coronatus (strain ATCC 28846 / CBS 209.66 / NRRL 28638) TaxID=796925 RepID=A0A137NZK9_CONC2|nr:hypothetical protein CONCODRAFT_9495 [Conidiobolus coronatus NRRL 28638]|eukprot:KXN68266.1 hypothetical protein CONCODRAFT_9495 [Conidiobolus coronatus NRRL 28638]